MTADEVKPYTRHWVEVYMGTDTAPTYRGMFLPHNGDVFVVHGEPGDDSILTPDRAGLRVADIGRVVQLEAPEWVVDSNRSAVSLSAQGLLE
jgi:hypothetical protein